MCGIAGFYSPKKYFLQDEITSILAAIAHRGPDAEGYFSEKNISLAHRRLSIVDLSEKSNQPILSANKRFVMVFNGEIYNFKELAQELSLKTNSDTEALIEAFSKWGAEFVSRLNGMFAFAIYDRSEEKTYLFRDRMGIKPLFYYLKEGQLAFASELKSLMKLNYLQQNKKINTQVLPTFLQKGYIPEPQTIYKDIYKFPKGHYAIIQENRFELKAYWQINRKITKQIVADEEEAKEQLKSLLESSVKYRLMADVPYGTFLSGGIDSSLVSAISQKISNQQIKTFTMGFAEQKFDETHYAKKIAQHIESQHFEYIVSEKDAKSILSNLFSYYDEPFADTSAVPTMLVAKMARQHVKMTLSGDGGDELFYGYGAYKWANRLHQPLLKMGRKPIQMLLKLGNSRLKRVAHLFNYSNKEDIFSHIFSQEHYFFSKTELKKLLTNDFTIDDDSLIDFETLDRTLSWAEKQALFDLNYYLPDDLLVKIDRATMQQGLETRVPILDYRIVEFALNLDKNLKIRNKESKYLLKKVLYDYVPKEFFEHPKWGFSIPLGKWLQNDLHFFIDDYLSAPLVNQVGIVNYSEVEKLKIRFLKHKHNYLFQRLWVLICLHKWYADIYLQKIQTSTNY